MNNNRINRRKFLLSRSSSQYPWGLAKLKQSFQRRKWRKISCTPELLRGKSFFKPKLLKTYENKTKMLFRRFFSPGVTCHQLKKLFKFKNRYRSTFRRILKIEQRFDLLVFRVYALKNVGLARFCILNGFFSINKELKQVPQLVLSVNDLVEINHIKVWEVFYLNLLKVIGSLKKYYYRIFLKMNYPFISKRKKRYFQEYGWKKKRCIQFFTRRFEGIKKIWVHRRWYNKKKIVVKRLFIRRKFRRIYPIIVLNPSEKTYLRKFKRFKRPKKYKKRKPRYLLKKLFHSLNSNLQFHKINLRKKKFKRSKVFTRYKLKRVRIRQRHKKMKTIQRQYAKRWFLEEKKIKKNMKYFINFLQLRSQDKDHNFFWFIKFLSLLKLNKKWYLPRLRKIEGTLDHLCITYFPIILYKDIKRSFFDRDLGKQKYLHKWINNLQIFRIRTLYKRLRKKCHKKFHKKLRSIQRKQSKRKIRKKFKRFRRKRRRIWRRRWVFFYWQKKRINKSLFFYSEFRKKFNAFFRLFKPYKKTHLNRYDRDSSPFSFWRVSRRLYEKKRRSLLLLRRKQDLILQFVRRSVYWFQVKQQNQMVEAFTRSYWKKPHSKDLIYLHSLPDHFIQMFSFSRLKKILTSVNQNTLILPFLDYILNELLCKIEWRSSIKVNDLKQRLIRWIVLSSKMNERVLIRFRRFSSKIVRWTTLRQVNPILEIFYSDVVKRIRFQGSFVPKVYASKKSSYFITKVKRKYLLLKGAFRRFKRYKVKVSFWRPSYSRIQIEYKKINLSLKYRPLPTYYLEINYNTLCFSITSGFDFLHFPHRTLFNFATITHFYSK